MGMDERANTTKRADKASKRKMMKDEGSDEEGRLVTDERTSTNTMFNKENLREFMQEERTNEQSDEGSKDADSKEEDIESNILAEGEISGYSQGMKAIQTNP